MISGFAFGLIIGYLSWYAFRPGETIEAIPIQKIAALLAVIAGATVLALFPSGTTLFDYYGVGLAVGFFFTPVNKRFTQVSQSIRDAIKKAIIARMVEHKKELELVQRNWIEIERVVQRKLEKSMKSDECAPQFNYVDVTDLQELQYDQKSVIYIMRHFAQQHVREGVEFRLWDGKPVLLKDKRL
ncbi:MAG: hypothetical protein M1434_04400 [Chloroflexi bacterium]|nr:hypothetical protein [Chloroflexota bacterium]MCL5273974.1 hypothetical protein [Chloroflexota bacterium]